MTAENAAGTQRSVEGKYLTFAVSKERYGLEILRVQEIIGVTHITPVPRCPRFIKGVINLRGKIIPVFDLRMKFGIESIPYDDKTCIIVTNLMKGDAKLSIGVIVDTVLEVTNFDATQIEPAPDYGSGLDSEFIIGMGKKDGTLSILVDIERILTDSETDSLGAVAGADSASAHR